MTRPARYRIIFCILTLGMFMQAGGAFSADPESVDSSIPQKITDFSTCALTTLKRNPQLQKTKIELEIRQLDEEDARWSYLPTVAVSSNYFFTENEATISFHAASYRPWEPYFSVQAQKLITDIATLKHIQATAQAIRELADTVLRLAASAEIDVELKEIIDLTQKKISYTETLAKTGSISPIELELERQTLKFVSAERLRNSAQRDTLLKGLALAMDLPHPGSIALNYPLAIEQILGSADQDGFENAPPPAHSINRQIAKKVQLLQEKKILLARARYLPDISVGVRSPDVIDTNDDTEKDFFFYVGMDLTLWDGHKRARDVTRQETVLRQIQYEGKETENNESIEWLTASEQYAVKKAEYAMSESVEKMKNLRLKQRESEYNTGSSTLPGLIDSQIDIRKERIEKINRKLAFNKAALQLRHLSGQLLKDTVNISWDTTSDD